jgi:ATP/maltotriose-dependent transcriptional regulator MalT
VPRLGAAFASMTVPVVLVLDDVHLLADRECRGALSLLADHVPPGSRLVLAGRDKPPLRIARLRAEGRILEIGPADLALTRAEAASLLRGAGLTLGPDEVTALHQRTEGWPVGLYLAALYLREGGDPGRAAVAFEGDDRLMREYAESELLSWVSPRQRVFLARSAVLERMSGPLCEAALELPDADAALADLARSNLLLVPLDRHGQWYRYHHLFREMLLGELERLDPGMMLGTITGEARALRTRLAADRVPSAPGASSLTAAELRVLPMLATHLSFPEIGAEMFLSPHTVKSQAMSIYRKLGASSRNQAVTRSRELGLIEGDERSPNGLG